MIQNSANRIEFEGFKNKAGANAFTMSPPKWIEATNAIGITSKSGRYGGTGKLMKKATGVMGKVLYLMSLLFVVIGLINFVTGLFATLLFI